MEKNLSECGQVEKNFLGGKGGKGGQEQIVFRKSGFPQFNRKRENRGKLYSQTVEKIIAVWYNSVGMKFSPSFEIYREKIEKDGRFAQFFDLLCFYNAKFNLTSIVEREEVFHKHFLDSLAGEQFFPKNAVCAEVGSGAGFPSIPLKLLRDDLTLTLFESVEKKCTFLKTAIKELKLDGVEVYCMRAEDAARGKFRETFEVCFARAVAQMNTLSEYCLPLVKKGGIFLAYKSDESELSKAHGAIATLGGGDEQAYSYELPNGYGKRALFSVTKSHITPQKYPRGRGLERKLPLF